MPQPKANLVFRPEKLGDLVITTPVFRAFKESFPDQPLHLLTDEVYAEAVRHDPHLDKIITLRWRGREAAQRDSFPAIYRKLRPYSYQRAALLYYNCEGLNWLMAALRVRQVAQVGGTVAAYLFGHQQVRRNRNVDRLHYSKLYLRVAERLGARTSNEMPALYLVPEEITAFRERFPFLKGKKKRVIVHPFGHGGSPNYSVRAYAELMELIGRDPAVEIFVTGTAKEREVWREFENPRVRTDWLGTLGIREWMAAANQVDLVIGGSTGVTHVAAALGQQTIGIYCPAIGSHPDVWGALGQNAHLFVVPENQCRAVQPCDSACKASLDCDLSFAVKPAAVAQRAFELLNQ